MEKLRRVLKINGKIIEYIRLNWVYFKAIKEISTGEYWVVEEERTYPNVNGGKPVLEVSNPDGKFMRLPKFLIDEKTDIINLGNKKKSFRIQ